MGIRTIDSLSYKVYHNSPYLLAPSRWSSANKSIHLLGLGIDSRQARLCRSLFSDHGKERVTLTPYPALGPPSFGGLSKELWRWPAVGHQHPAHLDEMVPIAAVGPDLWSLLEEYPVGKGHDHLPMWAHNRQQIGRHSFRLLEVLPTSHDQHRIHAGVFQRQPGINIEVLDPVAIQSCVGLEFLPVNTMADHLFLADILGEVANPAAHQIKHHGAGRYTFATESCQPR